jgi:heme exporter protein A
MRLTVTELACVRGGRQVFSRLCFAVTAGEALAIAGPNGAGKSSLLRVIAGLLRPSHGLLVLEGGDPEFGIGEQAHYLGHLDALKLSLTVAENLAFWTGFLGGDDGAVRAALAAVGLERLTGVPASFLSAGQRRRLSIARLLAVKRPLWLLDEPTTALDAAGQALLAGIMREHLRGGGLILAAAHGPIGLDEAAELRLGGLAQ